MTDMKRSPWLFFFVSFALLASFFVLTRDPVVDLPLESQPIKARYEPYTEGMLAPGEMPFVASGAVVTDPFSSDRPMMHLDGKEVPTGESLGRARFGSQYREIYYSARKFYRVIPTSVRPASPGSPSAKAVESKELAIDVAAEGSGKAGLSTAAARAFELAKLKEEGYRPAVILESGERVIPTGELNVIPDPSVGASRFAEAVASLGMEVRRRASETDEWWLLKTGYHDAAEILREANRLAQLVPVRFVEPNWIREVRKRSVPKDPLYKNQWHLKNSGQTAGTLGADINVEPAWALTPGAPQVIVAVFDDGFDIGHSDLPLANALFQSRDFVEGGSSPRPRDNDREDPDNHGTACWGLIAALRDNNRGVAGVAPGVTSMLLRSPMEMDERATADAIRWAAEHGAHVMSNSWGYADPGSVVTSALSYARKSGRGGRGTLVFFASGNENADIGKTNDLSNNGNVLAIGATTHQDRRTTYSNYGGRLFAVAPAGYGDGVGLITTDRAGSKGYTSSSYTDENGTQFDGTSGACPIAAGIAALCFSVNPNLSADAVAEILKNTARKVQPGSANYDASGWSAKYGHGRLDAAAAVAAARNGGKVTASTGAIAVTVRNRNTDAAVENATVSVADATGAEVASARGARHLFEPLAPGKYKLRISAGDYKPTTRTVTLAAGKTSNQNVALTPIPLPSIVATCRQYNTEGRTVYAQGVTVSITGPKSATAPTGWGETAGKAKFYSLPAGRYRVFWNGHSGEVTVVLGETAYIDLGP